MTGAPPRIVVLGAGMAGLSAAWECVRQGVAPIVLEPQTRAGGLVRTDRVGDFVLDAGPDAFLASKAGGIDLCRELGIADAMIGMKEPRGAYVLREDRLHALPEGGAFGIATRLGPFLKSTLLSPAGKLRVALEPIIPSRRQPDDESAGAFFRRRFGAEAARRIAQPLLGGIHAGDLETLSAESVLPQLVAAERAGRSVLATLRAQGGRASQGGVFRSFAGGMRVLVDSVMSRLDAGVVRLGEGAAAVRPTGGAWEVATTRGDSVPADILLMAVPAAVVATLLGPVLPGAADLAGSVRYVSSAGVLAVYKDAQIARPLRGSGYVSTPGSSRESLLATSWLTNKWAGRAPSGFTVLRGFFGGALDEAVLRHSDDDLIAKAHRSWSHRFGIEGDPVLTRVVRWDRSSPQHEVGHAARTRDLEGHLRGLPLVSVAGSGFRAVGIPDVVDDARRAMREMLDRWRAR